MINSCHFDNEGSYGSFGPWGWIGMILEVIFWIGLAIGLIVLFTAVLRGNRVSPALVSQSSAKDILQARYARGEITREQYETLKRDLA